MTNIKYLVLLFFVLSFASCAKINDIESKDLGKYTLLDKTLNFKNEMAFFTDMQEYEEFVRGFANFSSEEKLLFLENIPYQTFSQKTDQLFEDLGAFESEEEEERFLLMNKTYLQKTIDHKGDQVIDVVDPSHHILSPIFNKDRLIQIGDMYFKFLNDYAIESIDKSKLMAINSVDEIENSRLSYRKVVKQISMKTPQSRSLNRWETWQLVIEPSRCRDRRKVSFGVGIFQTFDSNINTIFYHLESDVVARRQGWTCSWFKYRTAIDWQDIGFVYSRNGSNFAQNFGNGSCSSCVSLGIRELIWADLASVPFADIGLKEVHSRVKTRGTGGEWLEVDKIY